MELVNGWLLARVSDKKGVHLGSGVVVAGNAYLNCKVIFKYHVGYTHTIEAHPDPHMFIHTDDIICILEEPKEPPKIINED